MIHKNLAELLGPAAAHGYINLDKLSAQCAHIEDKGIVGKLFSALADYLASKNVPGLANQARSIAAKCH